MRQSRELEALDMQRKIAVTEAMVDKKSIKLNEIGKPVDRILLLNVKSGDSLIEKVPDTM